MDLCNTYPVAVLELVLTALRVLYVLTPSPSCLTMVAWLLLKDGNGLPPLCWSRMAGLVIRPDDGETKIVRIPKIDHQIF